MITVLRFRPSVTLDGLDSAGARILATVDNATRVLGLNLTVTCGTDSHGPDDPHTQGHALDLSIRDLTPRLILNLGTFLGQTLGPLFTVLLETPVPFTDPVLAQMQYLNPHATGPHYHVQLRKNVAAYPPPPVETT